MFNDSSKGAKRLAKSLMCTVGAMVFAFPAYAQDDNIPNLVGTWVGENKTYSEAKGYKNWTKTIRITEQRERIFKGNFTYFGGSKEFFGVIYPNNTFTWVSTPAKGYNHGAILSDTRMTACYVETGAEASVGCAELSKKNE